jgi:putative transcriptional regulator
MSIRVRLAVVLAEKKMMLKDLEEKTGISLNNLSVLKTDKAKAIRFSTLAALCKALDCQPGDLLQYQNDGSDDDEI